MRKIATVLTMTWTESHKSQKISIAAFKVGNLIIKPEIKPEKN